MNNADELEGFKRLNLGELAVFHGYRLDRKQSSRSNLVMRHADGDKIIVATGENGNAMFYSTKTNANGTVLDFVIYRQGGNLGHARKVLRAYTGQQAPIPSPSAHGPHILKPEPITRDRAALVVEWHRFRPYGGGYLESRGLAPATIAAFADRLRIDERGNVAFRHDDLSGLCGWEKKNQGFTGYAKGGSKGLFACRVGMAHDEAPPRLIVAESALDAMSYHQHNPGPGLYLSFAGGLSPHQVELLAHVLTKYPAAEIVTATDADEQGETFAALILAHRPDAQRARPPIGKDWNDALKRPDGPPSGLNPLACLL